MDKPISLALEFDDFSPRNTNLGLLEELREHFPGFKVTMFTVAWEVRFGEATPITLDKFAPFVNACIKAQDWIEIAVHGLTHGPSEFKTVDYDNARKWIGVAEKMFINRKIPYTKIFKAPQWELTPDGKKAAEDLGFKVVEDHYYNWNLKDPRPDLNETLIGHGHVQVTMGNGIEQVMDKLLTLPTNTEFKFLSEVLGADKIYPDKLEVPPSGGGDHHA